MFSAASPVSEGVFTLLQDVSLQAAAVGGVFDDVPENPSYPFLWYELFSERDVRGFGGGGLPEIELRTHVFSQFAGKAEAQEINRLAIAVLRDAVLVATGYRQCGRVVYRETTAIADGMLNGVKVHELVSTFTIWVEE